MTRVVTERSAGVEDYDRAAVPDIGSRGVKRRLSIPSSRVRIGSRSF